MPGTPRTRSRGKGEERGRLAPHQWAPLRRRSPVVRALLVVHVPNSRNERRMALALGPLNRSTLGLECAERTAGMVFDDEIRDWGPFPIALRACLDVNVRNIRSPPKLPSTRLHRSLVNAPPTARSSSLRHSLQEEGLASRAASSQFESTISNWLVPRRTNSSAIPRGFPTRCLLKNMRYVASERPGQACLTLSAENGWSNFPERTAA